MFFENLGLKTPKYRFLYGNLNEIMDKGYSSSFHEWTSELGKTYGLEKNFFFYLIKSIFNKFIRKLEKIELSVKKFKFLFSNKWIKW